MLYSTDHAIGVARDLADALSLRLANNSGLNSVRQAQTSGSGDPAGYPMIFVSHNGNEAAGQPVVGIRIMNIDVGARDAFGNPTLPFAPSQLEFAYELAVSGAPIVSMHDFALCLFQCTRPGTIIVQEAIANGSAVNEANMNVALANPLQTLQDIDWGPKGNT